MSSCIDAENDAIQDCQVTTVTRTCKSQNIQITGHQGKALTIRQYGYTKPPTRHSYSYQVIDKNRYCNKKVDNMNVVHDATKCKFGNMCCIIPKNLNYYKEVKQFKNKGEFLDTTCNQGACGVYNHSNHHWDDSTYKCYNDNDCKKNGAGLCHSSDGAIISAYNVAVYNTNLSCKKDLISVPNSIDKYCPVYSNSYEPPKPKKPKKICTSKKVFSHYTCNNCSDKFPLYPGCQWVAGSTCNGNTPYHACCTQKTSHYKTETTCI